MIRVSEHLDLLAAFHRYRSPVLDQAPQSRSFPR